MSDTGDVSTPPQDGDNTTARKVPYSRGYTRYVLGVLVAVYAFSFIELRFLAIFMPAIKADLALTDTQIGLFWSTAFGIFHAALGIPVARLADRYSRVGVIAVCLAIGSTMTAVSGLATNYWQLLVARIGVGIGEAGCRPPSHSLIADCFSPDRRASALGIYHALGIPVGILILYGYLVGGLADSLISESFDWHHAFLAVGLPGIALALLMKFTVKEPPRDHSEGRPPSTGHVPFSRVVVTMWGFRSFRRLAFGAATQAFVGYGAVAWMPSFMLRTHGMSPLEVAAILTPIVGVAYCFGTFLGGILADRLARHDARWHLRIPGHAILLAVPFGTAAYLTGNLPLSLALHCVPAFMSGLCIGPTFAMTQTLAPPAMRATASALLLFIINIIGPAFGPFAVGTLSDLLQGQWQLGESEALRWSLFACGFIYLISFANYMLAARTLREDLRKTAAGSAN